MKMINKLFVRLAFSQEERIVMKICSEKLLATMNEANKTKDLSKIEKQVQTHINTIMEKVQ